MRGHHACINIHGSRLFDRHDSLRVIIMTTASLIRGIDLTYNQTEPDMEVAAFVRNELGQAPINQLERINPDVTVLDIEMPELEQHLRAAELLAKNAISSSSSASTLTRRNAEISFRALSLARPTTFRSPKARGKLAADCFRHDLIQKIPPPPRRQGPRSALVSTRARLGTESHDRRARPWRPYPGATGTAQWALVRRLRYAGRASS